MGKYISALPSLQPLEIIDASTGEILPLTILNDSLVNLTDYVQSETQRLWGEHKNTLIEILNEKTITSPAEFARQNGISSNAVRDLPKSVKAKSRVDKLVQHKLVTEAASYVRNPNPLKQEPSFMGKINLGATDKQFATLSVQGNRLTLLAKLWEREYLLTFTVPSYVLTRDIIKYSLPTIQLTKKGYGFIFSIEEKTRTRARGSQTAGVDLGRVTPYVLAVTNAQGARMAHYVSTPRLTQLNNKRERLLREKASIARKAKTYENLGLDNSTLLNELGFVRGKSTRLGKVISQKVGSEIRDRLLAHDLNLVHVEDLSWVNNAKGGSRWTHSTQQDAIKHALTREGIRVRKVSPRNSSRVCCVCGARLSHAGRSVRCSDCKTLLDRDYNAAMNIASLNHLRYPLVERTMGDDCTNNTLEVMANQPNSLNGTKPQSIRKLTNLKTLKNLTK